MREVRFSEIPVWLDDGLARSPSSDPAFCVAGLARSDRKMGFRLLHFPYAFRRACDGIIDFVDYDMQARVAKDRPLAGCRAGSSFSCGLLSLVFGPTHISLFPGSRLLGALTFLFLRVRLPFPLRSSVFYVISRLSFGVYLLHPGAFAHLMSFHTHLFGEGFRSFLFAFMIWGTVSLALAFVTFSFTELPFLKMRERLRAKNRVIDAAHGEASNVT
jgi:peptidoglycan/LPS O-acetylase OafA/YrhL